MAMQGYVSARTRAQLVDVLLAAQIALYALRVAGAVVIGVAPHGELGRTLARGARLSQPFLLVLFVATAAALFWWLDRAKRNLGALGVDQRVQLLALPQVVRHVWLASDPTPPGRQWLLVGWWPMLIFGLLGVLPPVLEAALLLTSAGCLVAIVRDAQRRQDEQFLDQERRRAVPLPTGEALR